MWDQSGIYIVPLNTRGIDLVESLGIKTIRQRRLFSKCFDV